MKSNFRPPHPNDSTPEADHHVLGWIPDRLRSFLGVAALNAVGIAVRFLGLFVLARIVAPTEFGIYSAVAALSLAVAPLLTLRFEFALPLTKTELRAERLTGAVLAVICVTSIVLFVVSSAVSLARQNLLGEYQWAAEFAHLFTLYCLLIALSQALTQALLRASQALRSAMGRLVRAAAVLIFQLLAIFGFAPTARYLVIGEIVGMAIFVVYLACMVRAPQILMDMTASGRAQSAQYLRLLKRYSKFALVGVPHVVTHNLLLAAMPLVAGLFYGTHEMGQYFFVRMIVFGALQVVSLTAYQVGVGDAVRGHSDSGDLGRAFRWTVLMVAPLTICASAAAFAFGPTSFAAVFGEKWRLAGELAAAMGFLILLEPIAAAVAFVPAFRERQGLAFGWAAAQNLGGLAAFSAVGYAGGELATATSAASWTTGAVILAYLAWCWSLVQRKNERRHNRGSK